MERHVEVVSDLWTAKELIAGVLVHDVLFDVMPAVALAAVTEADAQRAVNKKAFVINLAKLHLIEI